MTANVGQFKKLCGQLTASLNASRFQRRSVGSIDVRLVICLFFILGSLRAAYSAEDSHAGYYYPTPQTRENYVSRAPALPNISKRSRIAFTVGLNSQQQKRRYVPGYHIFAKGEQGEKLIIVASGSGRYNTLFRLRALLASLSADARTSPLFQQAPNPENLNFLDLCSAIGIKRVTLSDGDKIAHRIDVN